MAGSSRDMTRQPSSESSSLSNINVSGLWTTSGQSSPEPSSQGAVSTPPTSMTNSNPVPSINSNDGQDNGRRKSARAKTGVNSYNLQALCDAQLPTETSPAKSQLGRAGSSRNVSGLTGKTLVDSEDGNGSIGAKTEVEPEADFDMSDTPQPPKRISSVKLGRKPSVKDRVKKAAGKLSSVLGKRSREVMEKGKGKGRLKWRDEKVDKEIGGRNSRMLKQLDTGSKGLLDEIDLDAETTFKQRPSKKLKTSTTGRASAVKAEQQPAPSNPMQKTSNGKRVKKWQTAGLYVGQDLSGGPKKFGSHSKKLQKKRPTSVASEEGLEDGKPKKHLNIGLPLFSYLDLERPFTIPYDIFAPSLKKGDERPKDWHQLNKNRLIGDAKDVWVKEVNLARSVCLCKNSWNGKDEGCGDECLNRSMEYECNEDNCDLPPWACANRAFSGLATRSKKGGHYDIGVEVVKTNNRGFGVRACRSFLPGQIVMEYTGEIITEEECQRRMHEVYKDKSNFYLMEMERGTHIDGTKGSMARFINHSCAPNCIVRLVKVNGVPRMGVFASDEGIMTGEELTYDYNFDNFGDNMQQCFCGAPTCRGHLGKKLSAVEQKKRNREEMEKSRLAELEAQKAAEKEARAKAVRLEQDKAGWRGWVDLGDPETRKKLKAEQDARKAKEATSDRAIRLAARRQSLPPPSAKESPRVEKSRKAAKSTRRQTTASDKVESSRLASDSSHRALVQPQRASTEDDVSAFEPPEAQRTVSTATNKSLVAPDTSSKFLEDLPRPTTSRSSFRSINFDEDEIIAVARTSGILRSTSPELGTDTLAAPARSASLEKGNSTEARKDGDGDIELADSEEERTASVSKKRQNSEISTATPGVSANVARKRSVLKSVGDALSRSVKGGVGKSSLFHHGSSNGKLKQSKLIFRKT